MEKRTFLKLSSIFVTGTVFSPLFSCKTEDNIGTNWAGNFSYNAENLHTPTDITELQQLVHNSTKVRALGSRHSFNSIADSPEDMISLGNFNQVESLDRNAQTVTVGAGMKYGDLARYLYQNGFAVHNLASLPHISIAGACATATHGSGNNNGNLATAISDMQIVTANGEQISLSRGDDQFQGAVVSLGGLGLITHMTLDIEPTFNVKQYVYQGLPLGHLETNFDEIMGSGYSVSLFTDWTGDTVNQAWIKHKIDENAPFEADPVFFDATLATEHLHPIEGVSAENCTRQLGLPGPWHERLPHFRMDFTPSSGEELQSEYFVPREHAYEAIAELYEMSDQIAPHLLISEIRTIAADDLWMSMHCNRDSVALHFTWKQDWPSVSKVLPVIEERLAKFDVRPHWGKLFTLSPSVLQSRYERMDSFQNLLQEYDPQGKFRNEFLEQYILG